VDAINFPESRHIDVSRSRWSSYGPGKRASLVLHEYLGVLNVNDKHYEISGSYADAFAAPEEKPKKFELGLSASYGAGLGQASSSRPGYGIFFGYKLNPRSTLGLKLDFRRHASGGNIDDYTEIAISYKYWLALGRKWSPYLQAGAGYVSTRSSKAASMPGFLATEQTYASHNDVSLQLGGGYRYSLLKDVGLDLGLHLHSVGANLNGTFLVGRVGVDVAF
jgi:opacity protein-like surface antigen